MAFTLKNFVIVNVIVLLEAALLAFLGVYGTDKMPFYNSYIFWVSTLLVGNYTAVLIAPWVFNQFLPKRSTIIKLIVVAAIVSLPVTIVLNGFSTGFNYLWPLSEWAYQFFLSFVISIVLFTIAFVSLKAAGFIDSEPSPMQVSASSLSTFFERLPIKYREATLYAVSSEDHYLRVYTDRGQELILMRLSDALRELENVDGLQTHRSWWVARAGISNTFRKNGKHFLVLKSDVEVPVSRTFLKTIQEENLI